MVAVERNEYFKKAFDFFESVMHDFYRGERALESENCVDPELCAEKIFSVLSHRRYTHLSKKEAEKYKKGVMRSLLAHVLRQEPIIFDYDLGPGYHASLQNDFSCLQFEPSLGELLAFRQIVKFARQVETIYSPGVRFNGVIDNVCAWWVNGVPLSMTQHYLARLNSMVHALNLADLVEVVAESSCVSPQAYAQHFEAFSSERTVLSSTVQALSSSDVENISRFVGHHCTQAEAVDRSLRYHEAQKVSEYFLGAALKGVRLTQRATLETMGFRSFSGSDVRLQCGEVDVWLTDHVRPQPKLITHKHHGLCKRWPVPDAYLPQGWPLLSGVAHVVSFY